MLEQAGLHNLYVCNACQIAMQVADKVRTDARVVVMERTNLRHMRRSDFPVRPALATLDLSFISVLKVLGHNRRLKLSEGMTHDRAHQNLLELCLCHLGRCCLRWLTSWQPTASSSS